MNKIITLSLATSIAVLSLNASTVTKRLSDRIYILEKQQRINYLQKLPQKINKLKKEIATLKKEKYSSQKIQILQKRTNNLEEIQNLSQSIQKLKREVAQLSVNENLLTEVANLKKQIAKLESSQEDTNDEVETRIDEIETSTMIDKINFGLEFRTRVDSFEATSANGDINKNNNIWSNRLRLNMSSKITDDMKFNGRLSMYKNWSDSYNYPYSSMDPMQARRPSDSSVFVERAYIDWTVINGIVPITLTLGRQPSSDGPSHQFKDNTVRKSTYSALSFDGATDGIVATANLQKISGVDGMALRVGYGKGYQKDTGNTYTGTSSTIKDSNVLGVFLDSGLGIDNSLFQISAVSATDVVTNIPNDNKNIGDMMLYTAALEFTNIKNSGLDLFAHYAISQVKPNGEYSVMDTNANISATNPALGFLTSKAGDKEQKDGDAFWLGARYTLPVSSMNNPRLGIEYNEGSQNWFSFTQGSNDLTNKLATRGNATEVYYIQPINRYAHIRLGAQMIDYKYTGSGYQIGMPMDMASAKTQNPNAIDKLNNYYLLFNVAY